MYIHRLKTYLENLPAGLTQIQMQGGFFNLEVVRDNNNQIAGVKVSNLGNEPSLPIKVFEVAIQTILNSPNQTAILGNAQNGRLGDGLEINSIEGQIAHNIYNIQIGKSAFRRITPVRRILEAAGVCISNARGTLSLVIL